MNIINIEKDEKIYYTKCTCTYCNCKFEAEGYYYELAGKSKITCPDCQCFSGVLKGFIKQRKEKKGE